MIYALCLLLILIGVYGVAVGRSTIKIVLGIMVMEHGVHLLIILIGWVLTPTLAGTVSFVLYRVITYVTS